MTVNSRRNTFLVIETIGVFVLMSFAAVFVRQADIDSVFIKIFLSGIILLFQGFWFYRLYIVAHEASHGKLFTSNRRLNDIIGSIILLPLMTPLNIYRKIHMFHHGFNRKDNHTSVLDTFTTKKPGALKRVYFYLLWYISVFFGGLFIHSLVSVVLFLFVPPRLARKISPAFKDWTMRHQLTAIALFCLGLGFHISIFIVFGKEIYLWTLGFPLLAFAWVLSLFVYIFHYKTTVGKHVRFNARSLDRVPIFSWILMNFNEHATHHQSPGIPWYELPEKRKALPPEFAEINQNTRNLFIAVLQQLKGPRIIDESNN